MCPDVGFLAENAEDMPLGDETFDMVTCTYLFHELPRDARRNVLREVIRVLRPGGLFVINDASQPNTSPKLAFFMERFHRMYHEPYFKGYLRDPMEDAMKECGFDIESNETFFFSKVVVGRKPA